MGKFAHLLNIGAREMDDLAWPDFAAYAHWCDTYMAARPPGAG